MNFPDIFSFSGPYILRDADYWCFMYSGIDSIGAMERDHTLMSWIEVGFSLFQISSHPESFN